MLRLQLRSLFSIMVFGSGKKTKMEEKNQKYEDRKKEEIIERLIQSFDRMDWGGISDKTIVQITFIGKLEVKEITANLRYVKADLKSC